MKLSVDTAIFFNYFQSISFKMSTMSQLLISIYLIRYNCLLESVALLFKYVTDYEIIFLNKSRYSNYNV